MTSLASLPVELITQIALETSRVSERDYFESSSLESVVYADKTVASMALISKYFYSTLRYFRFRTIRVRLCQKKLANTTCGHDSQRIEYITSKICTGAVRIIHIIGSEPGIVPDECVSLHKRLFLSPALQSVKTLGLVNPQRDLSLISCLPRNMVETLLLSEIQHEDWSSPTFSQAMCQYLASFTSIKSTHLTYYKEGFIDNGHVLEKLNLKALRVFFNSGLVQTAPLLGLTMLEIEPLDIPALVRSLKTAKCKLLHLRVLSIFTWFELPQGGWLENADARYPESLHALVERCPKLEELKGVDLNGANMEILLAALPATINMLSGDMWTFNTLVDTLNAVRMVASRSTLPAFQLELNIWGEVLDETIEEYLEWDDAYDWLPKIEIGEASEYASSEAFKQAYDFAKAKAICAIQQVLGRVLRQTFDYHHIRYNLSGWPDAFYAELITPGQHKMYAGLAPFIHA
jgi:hypothetical protein